MKKWNDIFNDNKRVINGQTIIIGEQNFGTNSILIKEEDGTVLSRPMFIDHDGNIYFEYNGISVYVSEFLEDFSLEEDEPNISIAR